MELWKFEFKRFVLDIVLAGKSIIFMPKTLNGPIWYIGVLMLCYIFAFGIAKFIKNSKLTQLAFFLAIIFGLVMNFCPIQLPFFNHDIARGLMAFFSGTLLGCFLKEFNFYIKNSNLILKGALFAFFIILLIFIYHKKLYLNYEYFTALAGTLIFPLLIVILYLCQFSILRLEIFKKLGGIAFEVYLWNFPIYITLHILIVLGAVNANISSGYFIFLLAVIHLLVAILSAFIFNKIKILKK